MADPDLCRNDGDGQSVPLRTCSRCRSALPANRENFSPIKSRNALHAWCKPCCAEDRKQKRDADPLHHRAVLKRSRKKHHEASKARNRARWPEYAERNAAVLLEKRLARKDTYNENRRKKYAADPLCREKAAAALADWIARNRDSLNQRRRDKWASLGKRERLRTYFGAAISHSLKGSSKGGKGWQAILGYTADDLRQHLERQFVKGMTWDNYGDWHVDHILPVASFSYETVDCPDFHACWAMPNLRPMWALDNIRKRDKKVLLI